MGGTGGTGGVEPDPCVERVPIELPGRDCASKNTVLPLAALCALTGQETTQRGRTVLSTESASSPKADSLNRRQMEVPVLLWERRGTLIG